MMDSPLNPGDLQEAPELAVLEILQRALDVAELSLKSAHPGGCDSADLLPQERETAACALCLLHQIAILGSMLREYTASERRFRAARHLGLGAEGPEF